MTGDGLYFASREPFQRVEISEPATAWHADGTKGHSLSIARNEDFEIAWVVCGDDRLVIMVDREACGERAHPLTVKLAEGWIERMKAA